MGTILASAIISQVSALLNDSSNVRWDATTDHLTALNEGQRAIVALKPDAYTTHASLSMAAGSKQALSSSYRMILNVTRNMGTDGATPGAVIRQVPRQVMDMLYPSYHTATTNNVVKLVLYDPDVLNAYWVYPPQPASSTHKIEAVLSVVPADVASTSAAITLDNIYQTALKEYILYRAYSKETETDYGYQRAQAQFQSFINAVKIIDGGEAGSSAQRRNVTRRQAKNSTEEAQE